MLKILCLVSSLLFSLSSHASLIDRGNGMIYDTVTNLTWLQDLNYSQTSGYDADGLMTWASAMQWAENLVFGGFDDWRLPTTSPVNGTNFNLSFLYDGSSDNGFNIDPQYSELNSLFYALGGVPRRDLAGNLNDPYGIISYEPFVNTLFMTDLSSYYFSSTQINADSSFVFSLFNGRQANLLFANSTVLPLSLAVREGDVLPIAPIPEPYTPLLMGIGLIVLSVICKTKLQTNDASMLLA